MARQYALIAIVIALMGCALFTRPTDSITVERQKFINAYARARVLYQHLHTRLDALCQTERLPKETCVKVKGVHQQATALDAEIQAKLQVPESEVDWDRVMRLLELTVGLVL